MAGMQSSVWSPSAVTTQRSPVIVSDGANGVAEGPSFPLPNHLNAAFTIDCGIYGITLLRSKFSQIYTSILQSAQIMYCYVYV